MEEINTSSDAEKAIKKYKKGSTKLALVCLLWGGGGGRINKKSFYYKAAATTKTTADIYNNNDQRMEDKTDKMGKRNENGRKTTCMNSEEKARWKRLR